MPENRDIQTSRNPNTYECLFKEEKSFSTMLDHMSILFLEHTKQQRSSVGTYKH